MPVGKAITWSESLNPHELKEIYWRSRRGLTELDLLLVPFVRDCYASLSEEEQRGYVKLLEWEDVHIYDLLQGRTIADDAVMQSLVQQIMAHDGVL